MKQYYFILLFITSFSFSQQAYYSNGQNNVNFSQTGDLLYDALQTKISNFTNTSTYTYGDVRDDFKIMELDPTDVSNSNVLLTYGYVNTLSCSSGQTDRRIRDKNDFGGGTCEYNREHVFARSNANPSMGSVSNGDTGIAADPQNLRATDVQRNGSRGNRKFGTGSGDSGVLGNGDYYPGDEWKGDIARIMMYMYTRYGDRCLPELNASGTKQGSTDMLEILLQWNADDPVSDIEDNRNNHLEGVYGNRNPFIDNPALATVIWGGTPAEDRWGNLLSTQDNTLSNVRIHPNPVQNNYVYFSTTQNLEVIVYDVLGKPVRLENISPNKNYVNIEDLNRGVYLVKLISDQGQVTKKLIKQ